jgi:hypothetical protein
VSQEILILDSRRTPTSSKMGFLWWEGFIPNVEKVLINTRYNNGGIVIENADPFAFLL